MEENLSNLEKEMAKRTIKQYCSDWSEIRYDEIHNKPYFIGKRRKDSETEILYPINSNKVLTYDLLKSSIVDSKSSAVNLAVYGSDSTVVLYKAHLGLKPPLPEQDPDRQSTSACSDDTEASKKRKINSVEDDAVLPADLSEGDLSTHPTKRTNLIHDNDVYELIVTSDNNASESSCDGQK